jgi:hypothetical protein
MTTLMYLDMKWDGHRSVRQPTGRHLLSLFFLPTTLQMTATRLLERCASDLCLLRSSLTSRSCRSTVTLPPL